MSKNILDALNNALRRGNRNLPTVINHNNNNRVSSNGALLEYYIKDLFCDNSYNYTDSELKLDEYQKEFSYLGNSNNPPDFIIKQGPAIEVKKLESAGARSIALNSSHPKDFLYSNYKRINQACRSCEDEFGGWEKKDMIYAIGNIVNGRIHSLWLLYGDCFCADKSSYERISDTIEDGISSIPGVDFSETNELSRINNVDPLGITYLRVRGMWGIAHPSYIFSRLLQDNFDSGTNIYVLMKEEKHEEIIQKPNFSTFLNNGTLTIKNVNIKDPNNPARDVRAVFYNGVIY